MGAPIAIMRFFVKNGGVRECTVCLGCKSWFDSCVCNIIRGRIILYHC